LKNEYELKNKGQDYKTGLVKDGYYGSGKDEGRDKGWYIWLVCSIYLYGTEQ
jgi:hypothetical protein